MGDAATFALWAVIGYLTGSIPFGYLVARARGVDIFRAGSGNIGATNVGRVLGKPFGVLVFAFDCLKGAVPAAIGQAIGGPTVGVVAGLAAFLGHMFPVWLRFRGGKGVATGAGVVLVLVPIPATFAFLAWVVVTAASRYVGLGSVAAAITLAGVQWIAEPLAWSAPLSGTGREVVTAFCLAAAGLVVVKHAGNLVRMVRGRENRLADTPMWLSISKLSHVLALGLWFGTFVFFNVAGVLMIASFKDVVEKARVEGEPRTNRLAITKDITDDKERESLAGALFGAAVGPLFPPYFGIQVVCGLIAFLSTFGFGWDRLNRVRLGVILAGLVTLAVAWPLANYVGDIRLQRYHTDADVRTTADELFKVWHLRSLLLNFVTGAFAGVALGLAAFLPTSRRI